MNKTLNIIPTPQSVTYTEGEILKIKKVCLSCKETDIIKSALSLFAKENAFELSDITDADLIIYDSLEKANCLGADDVKTFDNKYADKQGYVIKKAEGKPVEIFAQTDVGCAYGLMTLLQIADKGVKTLTIRDYPDFKTRSNSWQIWAELGIWSYDYGDGADELMKRYERKLDMCLKYKLNAVYADAFGLDADRFPEYSKIMRHFNDEAKKRGINLFVGCYGMGYGMAGFPGAFKGKSYKNKTYYPDGEIYECIGTHDAWKWISEKEVDRSKKLTLIHARDWGTCLSNDELLGLKVDEFKDYLIKTHCTGLYIHNMDSHEIHPELWLARCDKCREKWPNDDLFAKDGCAGAFAEYFTKLSTAISNVKDGDYDSSKDLKIAIASPGYTYYHVTSDADFDQCVTFWNKVSEFLEADNISITFREQFFYQEKDEYRIKTIEKINHDTVICNFNGADGFYDDKLFTTTAMLSYAMKGADHMMFQSGNSFQEPLQIFNSEYAWNCEGSSFATVGKKPSNYKEITSLYDSMIASTYRPESVYGDRAMIDVICQKLYGDKVGNLMSRVFKLSGPGGEPPIACAASVDLFIRYNHIVYDFRWDNADITWEQITKYKSRFEICRDVTRDAVAIMKDVLNCEMTDELRSDLEWLSECFEMGYKLSSLLAEYMTIYEKMHIAFENNSSPCDSIMGELDSLNAKISQFDLWLKSLGKEALDPLGGSLVRRAYIAEHLDYWTKIMKSSLKSNKRIPDDVRALATKDWW